jgi:hypothetical protein
MEASTRTNPEFGQVDGAPPPELRAELLEKLAHVDAPTVREIRLREAVVTLGGLLIAWIVFEAIGGVRVGPRPTALVVATSLGSAALAGAAAWLVLARTRTMLSPPRFVLLGLVAALPLAFLAWKVGVTAGFASMDEAWPERPGWRCLRNSLLIAAPLFAAFALRWLGRDPSHPRTTGAALGIVAGASTAVLVDLWCPVAYVPHLLLGHLLPMAVLALIGAIVGHFAFAVRVHEIKRPRS